MNLRIYSGKKACYMLFIIATFSIKQSFAQQFQTTIDGWNAFVHLPDEYNDSVSKRYPVIIFVCGLGEVGTNASKLLINGPSKFIASGSNMQFVVNGKLEKPIVISIQPIDPWAPHPTTMNRKLDTIVSRWRCDLQRINATGLSMGGQTWQNYVNYGNPAFTNRLASIVSMSAPGPDNPISNMRNYALAGGKWWGFEGTTDPRDMDKIRDTMNAHVAGSARYYKYTGGHCCWNTWYIPSWNENSESIYTWMLKQKKPGATFAIPEANAGRDSTIPVPASALTLKGAGNDPVGNPINFAWTKIAGPSNGTILNPTSAQTNLTGLGTGTYKFELKVVNALGGTGKDTIIINNGNLVLPVKLISFTVTESNKRILLEWKTNTEVNASHFIVERSYNGTEFEPVGEVAAVGNSSVIETYQYIDITSFKGIIYYRLRMVDLDASFMNSKVITLNSENMEHKPVDLISVTFSSNKLQMIVNATEEKVLRFRITDAAGRVICRSESMLTRGSNTINKMLAASRGIYYATFITEDGPVTRTVLHH